MMNHLQPKEAKGKNKVWNTERVLECQRAIQDGLEIQGGTPFYEGNLDYRAADIIFEYSEEELVEIAKCASDIVYFANKYCVSMTDDGVQQIRLRDYQEDVLRAYQDNRFVVFLASRQIGKTVMTGIFITWYLLFNVDKNVLVIANKGATTAEIIDKIKVVIKGLPFFLKPGISVNNQMRMCFDNGCRMFGQSTTKTAAIGYTIHLAYMDEFAHIHANIIEPYYRSIYPTLSSSKISRLIITSTANGKNKFWEIYNAAVEKKNEFKPLRVDWWQVPGRDEAWKKKEIAQLGNEELFNQEYGNQFIMGDALLLPGRTMEYLTRITKKYVWKQIDDFEDEEIDYRNLKWHPNFSLYDIDPESKKDKFAFSVDISDGVGRDFSIINIFKIEPMSKAATNRLRKDRVEMESSLFRLRQVGIYRSNKSDAEALGKIAEILTYRVFGHDNVRISLEMNFKGDLFKKVMEKNDNYYEEIFLHTRHSEKNHFLTIGVKLHKHNKVFFCRELRRLILEKRIIIDEEKTVEEFSNFGLNKKGTYSSQVGHDDIAMTGVNLVPMVFSETYAEAVEDMFDLYDDKVKEYISKKVEESGQDDSDDTFSYLKDIV